MVVWIAIAAGGAAGAALRFFFSRAFAAFSFAIPAGTLCANVVASLGLGVLAAAVVRVTPVASALLATGIAGGLSTFSTFVYETVAAFQEGDYAEGLLNIGLNVAGGLLAVVIGVALGRSLA